MLLFCPNNFCSKFSFFVDFQGSSFRLKHYIFSHLTSAVFFRSIPILSHYTPWVFVRSIPVFCRISRLQSLFEAFHFFLFDPSSFFSFEAFHFCHILLLEFSFEVFQSLLHFTTSKVKCFWSVLLFSLTFSVMLIMWKQSSWLFKWLIKNSSNLLHIRCEAITQFA